MAAENLFVEGLDPTPLPAVGASELLQMQRELLPESYVGLLYVSETEPDIVNNTHYTRFLWLTPSTGAVKYYTGAAWATIINVSSLSGGVITAESIPISKLDPDAGSNLKLIRVNTAGTAFEYVTKAALFGSGEVAVVKIVPGTSRQFLMTVGGIAAWTTLLDQDVLTALGTNKIPINALLPSIAGYSIPRQNPEGTAVEWATPSALFPNNSIPVANLNSTGAVTDYVLKIDAAGNKVWGAAPNPSISLPSPIPTTVVMYDTGSWVCPSGIGKFKVRAWAGGAGTGLLIGGGAGAYHEETFTAIEGSYTIVVGEGGAAFADGNDTTITDPTGTIILTVNKGLVNGNGGAAAADTPYSHSIAGGNGDAGIPGSSPRVGGTSPNGGGPGAAPGSGGGALIPANSAGSKGRVIIEY